jgi:hypothetical protein
MTTIELKYDPFAVKTTLTINDKEATLRCFGTGKETRLRDWIGDFFTEVMKKCNFGPGSECAMQFYGTQSDYEDVSNAYNEYQQHNESITIQLLPCNRYPQSLSKVLEYVSSKHAEYDAEIIAKKGALEKLNNAFAGKVGMEAEKNGVNLDILENTAAKTDEMLEIVYQKELSRLKVCLVKIREQAELLPMQQEKEKPLLLSERFQKLLEKYKQLDGMRDDFLFSTKRKKKLQKIKEKMNCSEFEFLLLQAYGGELFYDAFRTIAIEIENHCTVISELLDSLVDDSSKMFCDYCNNWLSGFSFLTGGLPLLTPMITKKDYSFGDTGNKPWKNAIQTRHSNSMFINGYSGTFTKSFWKTLDDSQNYINTIIDDTERHCTETLAVIKQHYENELKTTTVPIMQKIEERKEYKKINLEKLALEKEITYLEGKLNTLGDISVEIERLSRGGK